FAELFVFRTRAREDRDEAAAGAINMVHVLARTQLGIGDIEEVDPTCHGTQCVPGVDMRTGIAGVSVAAAKRDGDTAIGGRGENEKGVLEVGGGVFREPQVDEQGRVCAAVSAPSAAIGTAEAHGGAIVVYLLKLQAEDLADREDRIGDERRAVGIE